MGTITNDAERKIYWCIIMKVLNTDNAQGFILYTYNQIPAFHVGKSRHIRNHIITGRTRNGIAQIAKGFPFAMLIFFRKMQGQIFIEFLL